MDKRIGVCLAAVGAEILAFASAAVLAAALLVPSVLASLVQQVTLLVAEGCGDAVLSVGLFGTIECPAAHLGSEVGTGDAEDLLGHNVVNALLQIGYLPFKPNEQPFGYFAQKDSTLAARVEKPRFRAAEQFLRQQVKHTVGQLRRSENLVAREVGQTVENIRAIIILHSGIIECNAMADKYGQARRSFVLRPARRRGNTGASG